MDSIPDILGQTTCNDTLKRDSEGYLILSPISGGRYDVYARDKKAAKKEKEDEERRRRKAENKKKNQYKSYKRHKVEDPVLGIVVNFLTIEAKPKKRIKRKKKHVRKEGDTRVGDIDVATLRPLSKPPHGKSKIRLKDPFEKMLDAGDVLDAITEAAKDKRRRGDVKNALADPLSYALHLIEKVRAGKWKPPKHNVIRVNEGSSKKVREITKPFWDNEQVVHHMVIRQFKKIVMAQIDANIFGSIPKRGTHLATKRMARWVKGYKGKKFYVAELDIRKFFDNIDHNILKKMFRWYIKDENYLALLDKIVDSYSSDREGKPTVGIPLGNYTSPWFANFYLLQMDELILQDIPGIDHYLRYMDNIYLFSTNKRRLHQAKDILSIWLGLNRNLEIKKDWQIYRFEHKEPDPKHPGKTITKGRAINSLGFVVHCDRVTVRKSIMKRIRRMAIQMRRIYGHRYTYHQATSMASRLGYLLGYDAHNYYHKYIRPSAPAKHVKKRVSIISKEQTKLRKMYDKDLVNVLTVGYSQEELLEKEILVPVPDDSGTLVINPLLIMKGVKGVI